MIHKCDQKQLKFLWGVHLNSTDDHSRSLAPLPNARDEPRKTRTAETKKQLSENLLKMQPHWETCECIGGWQLKGLGCLFWVMKIFLNGLWWWLHNPVNILKTIKLYTVNGWITWYVNSISMKRLLTHKKCNHKECEKRSLGTPTTLGHISKSPAKHCSWKMPLNPSKRLNHLPYHPRKAQGISNTLHCHFYWKWGKQNEISCLETINSGCLENPTMRNNCSRLNNAEGMGYYWTQQEPFEFLFLASQLKRDISLLLLSWSPDTDQGLKV